MALNLNIGILGHVDSGKTSLAKCLSDTASTAAFDKNPQSQQRGITLDLGFSSFTIPVPDSLKSATDAENMQYTLVDCPGHASLIKTIIGGAQIIDMMLLIVDVTKGIQTQTAECLVIGEITSKKLIIVLNKIDLVEGDQKIFIQKMTKKIKKTLLSTSFKDQQVPIVNTSAHLKIGIENLIETIRDFTFIPRRNPEGNFLFAVDHCFGIKGKGTVMTGTVLEGSIKVNDTIDVPHLASTKKIKSMQMFKKPVLQAIQGDRVGICVTQFDPKLIERGIACTPGHGQFITCAIIKANTIKYFKGVIQTKSKFHITIGYETTLAKITVFKSIGQNTDFNLSSEYSFSENIDVDETSWIYFLFLEFEKTVFAVSNSILIGSKLDMDINKNSCRLAFWGKVIESSKITSDLQDKLKIFKMKSKKGVVERVVNENTVIIKNMFKKETDLQKFINLSVKFSTGEIGKIESSFGQSGKVKIYISDGFKSNEELEKGKIEVVLEFKKFLFDAKKMIYQ